MSYQIGPFSFQSLGPMPQPATSTLATEARAGVHGVSVWSVGEHGKPFTVATTVDTTTHAAAQAVYEQYVLAMVAQNPVTVIYAGRVMPHRYLILSVEPIEVTAVLFGMRNGNARYGLCRCRWTLLPINPFIQQQ